MSLMLRNFAVALLLVATLFAADMARAENRVALVVGNTAYAHAPKLTNPTNDARDMAAALKSTGFDVIEAIDADKAKFDAALRGFAEKLGSADVALFFYAGHGLQVGAENYLVPTDAKLERERDLEFEAVKLQFVLRQLEIDREGKTTIVILDACRDNPLARNLARTMGTRSAAIGRGLAAASAGLGTFISYSTQPGNVALDGDGRNSPFAKSLVKHLAVKGRNLQATMIAVRKDVVASTGGKQVPWDHSAMTGDFYFVPGDAAPEPGSVSLPAAASSTDVAALRERLRKLEDDAKVRDSTPAAGGGATPAQMADMMKLAELRARAANLDDLVKGLQKKLMDTRMQEGRASNPEERQKLSRDAINIQMEWTRRGLDLKKMKVDIAALEQPKADTVAPAPATASAKSAMPASPDQSTPAAQPEVSAATPTNATPTNTTPTNTTIEALQARRDALAKDYQDKKATLKPGHPALAQLSTKIKEVERQIAAEQKIVAKAVALSGGAQPAVTPTASPHKVSLNFDESDNVALKGSAIRSLRAPSPVACRDACDKDAACAAFQHGRKHPVMGTCRLFSKVIERVEDKAWRSGLKKPSAKP